jgi:hypothetical protein
MARLPRLASLGVVGVCLMAAGCSMAPRPAGAHASAGAADAQASPSSSAECFLLTGAQVRAAVGLPVEPATALLSGPCIRRFPHGVGGVNYGVTSFSSAAQARADLRRTESSDVGVRGLTVRKVRGLGQEAITLTGNQSAAALVIAGSRELVVNISLRRATSRMAVTLAAEALRRM